MSLVSHLIYANVPFSVALFLSTKEIFEVFRKYSISIGSYIAFWLVSLLGFTIIS